MPPQAEADVVGEVFVAVVRVEHAIRLVQERRENNRKRKLASGGPDLPAIPCKKAGGRTVLQP
jgi:hypothetical protein